jgi:type IV pilus assembly protein PilM
MDGKNGHLERFAQVGLPPGAVVEGEVRDPAVVATALKKLWSDGGFRSKDVVLGVSSQRAMVRLIEMPLADEKELRSALRYEIGDLLPIPVEQAIFDFTLVGPGKPGGDGGQTTQVLVVVAQKDIVKDEIAVVNRAGLHVRAVDASSLALLRAVPAPNDSGALDAVISLGAQLAVVAVRQGGTPRFMRTAAVGTDEAAEPARVGTVARLVPSTVRDKSDGRTGAGKSENVIEEVRSSIEYFLSHAQGQLLERVQITGGGALVPGLADRLAATLGVPVVAAQSTVTADRAKLNLTEAQFEEASQRWATAVGLALWGTDRAHAASLLPPEIAERQRQRRMIVLAAAGVVVLAGGLGVVSHNRTTSTSKVNAQVAIEQQQAAELQTEVDKLQTLTIVQGEIVSRRELSEQALAGDIDWVGLDRRIEAHAPPGVVITSVSFSASTTATAPTPTPSAAYVGNISISATAKTGAPEIAQFIDSESKVVGVGAVWVPQGDVDNADTTAASPKANTTMSFTVSAEVTTAALSQRAAQMAGGAK